MSNSYQSRPDGAKPRPPFEFDLDKGTDHAAHFICDGGVALLDLSDLASVADVDAASPEGIAAIAAIFRTAMTPDTYRRFRQHTRDHDTDPDVQLEIMTDLVEHVLSGHSRRRSPSPPGPPAMNGGSAGSVPWPGLPSRELTDDEIARIRASLGNGG